MTLRVNHPEQLNGSNWIKMKFSAMTEEEILGIVEPMMDNCLEGSNEDNHAKHVRDFTDRLKQIVTPEDFRSQKLRAAQLSYSQADRPLGFFAGREFVCLFRKKDSIGIVWRQSLSTSDDEFVNHAVFVAIDNKILINHCLIC